MEEHATDFDIQSVGSDGNSDDMSFADDIISCDDLLALDSFDGPEGARRQSM